MHGCIQSAAGLGCVVRRDLHSDNRQLVGAVAFSFCPLLFRSLRPGFCLTKLDVPVSASRGLQRTLGEHELGTSQPTLLTEYCREPVVQV